MDRNFPLVTNSPAISAQRRQAARRIHNVLVFLSPSPLLSTSFTAREKFATGMPAGVNFISLSAPAYPISNTLFNMTL